MLVPKENAATMMSKSSGQSINGEGHNLVSFPLVSESVSLTPANVVLNKATTITLPSTTHPEKQYLRRTRKYLRTACNTRRTFRAIARRLNRTFGSSFLDPSLLTKDSLSISTVGQFLSRSVSY